MIMGRAAVSPPVFTPRPKEEKPKVLLLPKADHCATHAVEYLHRRGIDYDLIEFCISTGRLYESTPYHKFVFVGMDSSGKAVMQISEVSARISSGTQTAATSITLSESPPPLKAIPCICLNRRLICFPMGRF